MMQLPAEDSSMIPANQYFLELDADGIHVSSDFYFRIAAEGHRMMKLEIGVRYSHDHPFASRSIVDAVQKGQSITYTLKILKMGLEIRDYFFRSIRF